MGSADPSHSDDLTISLKTEAAGRGLDQTARIALPEDIETILEQPLGQPATAPVDALVVHIMGEKLPFLIHRGRTILGRVASSEKTAAVDLSKYYARVLGVSREHAALNFSKGGWVVEDLGSTNGTYVNDTRLTAYRPHSLRNGDMVRLGQLTLFVYFQ
jgi:pSer/pThr/pTyr-binding forkhead associated (FHA) protein